MTRLPGCGEVGSGDYLLDRLHEEVSRAARHKIPLACLLFRVKAPAEADVSAEERLAHAASVLARHMVRDSDIVAALGSGCFGILANTTVDGARELAESLARGLRGFDFVHTGRHLDLDVRYGIANLASGKTPFGLLEEARAALDGLPALHAPEDRC
jgi:PleD family two-component response regulator